MKKHLSLLFLLGVFLSCIAYAEPPIAKVRVSTDGQITLNGSEISLQELDPAFAKLSAKNGVVWYYREAARREPPPQAMEVIKLVVKYRLPISMSTKPDFSDVVNENGNSVPRKP